MKLLYLLPFILFGCSVNEDPVIEPEPVVEYVHGIVLMEVCPTNGNKTEHDVTKATYDEVMKKLQETDTYCVTVSFRSETDKATVSGWYGGSYAP